MLRTKQLDESNQNKTNNVRLTMFKPEQKSPLAIAILSALLTLSATTALAQEAEQNAEADEEDDVEEYAKQLYGYPKK